jgi:hypothetical protein
MQSLPQIQLVDIHGRPITPDDQGPAAAWPASNLVDGWHWEPEPGSGQDDAPTAAERADFESWLASQGGIAWEESRTELERDVFGNWANR